MGGVDALLNLLLFAPLGVGLGLAGARPKRAILGMVAGTISIELLQLFVIPGRDPTLRDAMLNSIGGAVGYAAGARPQVLVAPFPAAAARLLLAWSAVWLVAQSIAAYALVPVLPRTQYYGQIARGLGRALPAFPGSVLLPMVDSLIIPNWEFGDDRVRDLLLRPQGALIQATVIPRGCAEQLSGIVRIADEASREVLLIAQDRMDLVFIVRTGAQVLRLRPMRYRLRDAFGTGSQCLAQGDTIQLQALYTPKSVFLRALREEHIQPSITQGWRLFLPFQMDVEPGPWSAALTALWIVGLTLPLGYWGRFASPGADRKHHVASVVLVITLVAIGIGVVPLLFGVPAASLDYWILGGGGAAAGMALAKLVLKSRMLTHSSRHFES